MKMRVKIADITKFISGVKALSGSAPVLGIMLETTDSGASLIFSDSKKALFKSIEAEISDDEKNKSYVIEFTTLNDGITKAQSSGNIKCTDLTLDFSGLESGEQVLASSEKFMSFQNGEDVEDKKIMTV